MYYYSASKNGFYSSDIHGEENIPDDCARLTEKEYQELVRGQSLNNIICADESGKPYLSPQNQDNILKPHQERLWRNSELFRADIELNRVQDSDTKTVGNVSEWRAYRKELRGWPEHPNFPDENFRPKSPDYKE